MPLPKHLEKAQVIITELEQPHRFDFAMQCACGFQLHGFASAAPFEKDADMLAAASTHLIQKHGVPPGETEQYIEVTPVKTVGGLSHDNLKAVLAAHAKKAKAPASIENIKVTTPVSTQHAGVSQATPSTATPLVETPTLSKEEIDKQIAWDKNHPTQEEQERTKNAVPAAVTTPAKPVPSIPQSPTQSPITTTPSKPATPNPAMTAAPAGAAGVNKQAPGATDAIPSKAADVKQVQSGEVKK